MLELPNTRRALLRVVWSAVVHRTVLVNHDDDNDDDDENDHDGDEKQCQQYVHSVSIVAGTMDCDECACLHNTSLPCDYRTVVLVNGRRRRRGE